MIPPFATAATTAAPVQLAGVPVPTTWSGLDVSTSWPSAGTGAPPSGLPGVGGGGVTAVRAMTCARNPAVSARVILRSGQNLPLAQVIASPAVARRSMDVANPLLFGTSVKWPPPVAVRCRALHEVLRHPSARDRLVRAEPRRGAALHDPGGDDPRDARRRARWDVAEVARHGRRHPECPSTGRRPSCPW